MRRVIGKIKEVEEGVEWEIDDFLSLWSCCYESPQFSYATASWGLLMRVFVHEVYDTIDGNGGDICFYLERTSACPPPIHLEYSVSVRTPDGRKHGGKNHTEVFDTRGSWFRSGAIRLDSQRMRELVPRRKLTVLCTLRNMQRDEDAEARKEIEAANNLEAKRSEVAADDEPKSSDFSRTDVTKSKESSSPINIPEEYNFTLAFDHFLEERRGIDVTFLLETPNGKEEIFAHKLVLAMRSSYFADELYGEQGNKQMPVVFLKNVNPNPFKHMIRYCYGWKPCLRTIEETCALLEVASQFKVISLMKVCQTFLRCAEIKTGNVFSVLVASEKTEDQSLRDMCNKLLQEKTKEVMQSYELHDVTPSMVRTIVDLPKMSLCSEYELIKWIFDWAKLKSQEEDSIYKNSREYLEKLFLQDMNFLDLTFEEFAILCKDNQGFFSLVEFQCISMNIAIPGTMEMPVWYNTDLRFREYTGLND